MGVGEEVHLRIITPGGGRGKEYNLGVRWQDDETAMCFYEG